MNLTTPRGPCSVLHNSKHHTILCLTIFVFALKKTFILLTNFNYINLLDLQTAKLTDSHDVLSHCPECCDCQCSASLVEGIQRRNTKPCAATPLQCFRVELWSPRGKLLTAEHVENESSDQSVESRTTMERLLEWVREFTSQHWCAWTAICMQP